MNDLPPPTNPSAPPGKQAKYARPEWERRFLLAGLPPGQAVKTAEITDRYLLGTRLRLRHTIEVDPDGTHSIYKLTQKVPASDGGPGLITTVYLNEDEHARLSALSTTILRKTRLSIPPYGVDAFAPQFAGLFLAEVEFDSAEEMHEFAAPPWAVAEVTRDPRFTGGRFATMTADELTSLLLTFGIHREREADGRTT
jgi:CYTH domain-containing protein